MPDEPTIPNHTAPGLASMPTAMIRLSAGFLEKLKLVAPKKKRSKLWYVIFAILVAIGAFVALHPGARGFVVTKTRAAIARIRGAPAAPPAISVAPLDVPSASVEASASVALPPPTTIPSASVAPSASAVPSASAAPSASASSWVTRSKTKKRH